MNRRDLIMEASAISGITQTEIKNALDPILEAITHALSRGEKVTLASFGTFEVRDRKERDWKNPKTDEILHVKAKKVVKFDVSPKVIFVQKDSESD